MAQGVKWFPPRPDNLSLTPGTWQHVRREFPEGVLTICKIVLLPPKSPKAIKCVITLPSETNNH